MVGQLESARSAEEFGCVLASLLKPGDVILMSGPLGAGKTTLTQGIARCLGCNRRVTSPTFVLLQEYDGEIPLRHADLYRLEGIGEVDDLGLDELFGSTWITVIEWGESVREHVPGPYLWIELEYQSNCDGREIRITGFGRDWTSRLPSMKKALSRANDSDQSSSGESPADTRH